MKIRAALVGYGYWGPKLARNIVDSSEFELVMVIERDIRNAERAKLKFPWIRIISDIEEIKISSDENDIDVIFIATPPKTHFSIALSALNNGWHVWLEKPATTNLNDALELCRLGKELNRKIVVDHPYLYSESVEFLRNRVTNCTGGAPLLFQSSRANLGIFSPDVSVLWDLVVHDVSILNYIFYEFKLETIHCFMSNPLSKGNDSIVSLNLKYEGDFLVSFFSNWLSPTKIRNAFIVFEKEAILWDDSESNEKIKIYSQDFSETLNDVDSKDSYLVNYRLGEIKIPRLEIIEPLRLAVSDFANHLRYNTFCRNSLSEQLETLRILELAEKSHQDSRVLRRDECDSF